MSDLTLEAAEKAAAEAIGASFSGELPTTEEVEVEQPEEEVKKFSFDADFQTQITALAAADSEFMRRIAHLLKPQFFEDVGEASVVNIALEYYKKYNSAPGRAALIQTFKDQVANGIIRRDLVPVVKDTLNKIKGFPISDRAFVEEKVAEFARHQAVSLAILKSVDLIEKKKFDKIEEEVRAAIQIGVNEDGDAYDYFEKIGDRTTIRIDDASGIRPARGITTGNLKLDELLYHKGWGRKELATIMGGAKSGKTTALIGFAKAASLKGFNVLYATLEVSSTIIAERLDASLSDTEVKQLGSHIHDVKAKIEALAAKAGALKIHEFPSGTFSPNMLRGLIHRYAAQGMKFDLVVVDYADIMAPNFRYNDPIENSKSVYVDLRAIASEEDVAMLTATQTNREGYKATVAKAEHVAEDFNKVRTVDLMISINITDEERSKGEARLYFAASRNQESGFTLFIKQNLAKMKFMESVLRVE